MIIQKWSAKIEGPCPPPMMAAAGCDYGRRGRRGGDGLLGGIGAAMAGPFDLLFGGRGVYGCKLGRRGGGGPCGPFFGPIPGAVVAVPRWLAAPSVGVFGVLW